MSDDEKSLLLLTSEDRDYWLNRAVYHEEQRNTAEAERDAARADAERLADAITRALTGLKYAENGGDVEDQRFLLADALAAHDALTGGKP